MKITTRRLIKQPKPKKCVTCGEKFTPIRLGQIACGGKCAFAHINSPGNKIKEKVSRELNRLTRAERKKVKDSIKTRSERLRDAQTAFNSFIRERDKDEPCISCGEFREHYDAGHYRSVGAHPELRFNELNNHRQCVHCNKWLSGNLVNYRINLIKKIGLGKVEWLEGHHGPKKYTVEEIEQIKATYRMKLRQLKRGEQ